MRSRTDIALGKPPGLWFVPRDGRAPIVRQTKEVEPSNLAGFEPETEEPPSTDAYADARADVFNE